ncbi:glycerate kinase [Microbacterium sp. 18062]|uniref:glycerate kinase n=1 Tax=Microbacterium sp. 18062 TaxID=2681410 RepID=UPI00135B61C3|nr:glycerate kinase [Microbacterium sp. 18062]
MNTSSPFHVLVAPSGFKESLDADTVAAAVSEGIRRVVPGAEVVCLPIVDGGEGTAAALAAATGGRIVRRRVTGPTGAPVDSHFAVLGDGSTAVVEMAAAAGLRLVPREARNPLRTSTRGVGELIRHALDLGCRRVLIGCGDSGTSDGGAGALAALGMRLLDAEGRQVPDGARGLRRVVRIDAAGLDPRLADVALEVACNPTNVLTGPRGVARVFGPQKGATPAQVDRLAKILKRWSQLLERDVPGAAGRDLRRGLGTGASGGLGAGLAAVGARLRPRFDVLLESIDLDAAIAGADLVVTAEGSIDAQTPHGKVPAEVARRAKAQGKPVLAMAGTIGAHADAVYATGIDAIQCILPSPVDLEEACARGAEFVADGTERAMRTMLMGAALAVASGTATFVHAA